MIPDVSQRSLQDLISLGGRTALVTGGASGIGFAVAKRLAQAGAFTFIADINEPAAQQAAKRLQDEGLKAAGIFIDVASNESIIDTADAVVYQTGKLNIWVNMAGIFSIQDTFDMTEAQWLKVIGVNLTGTFLASREAARRMIALGNTGVIINAHATAAYKIPYPGLSHYIASMGGIESLTRSLAMEFGPFNIHVLAVSPTITIKEEMQAQKAALTRAFSNGGGPQELYGNRLPLRRIAVPDDIARVVLFCASDLSLIMTGGVLAADAGDSIC